VYAFLYVVGSPQTFSVTHHVIAVVEIDVPRETAPAFEPIKLGAAARIHNRIKRIA
jgi:hypothetical protein